MKSIIKKLPEERKYNGLKYKLIKRTDDVAMYETYNSKGKSISIEVFIVFEKKKNQYYDREYEAFPTNRDWSGRTDCRAFSSSRKKELAEKWFDHLVQQTKENETPTRKIQDSSDNYMSFIRKAG